MDMLNSYWERVSKQRVTRRRALAASSGGMLGLTLLAGCGGDGSAGVEGDASGLVVNKVDTSKQAKRGGIMKRSTDRDAAHLDVHQAVAPLCLHKDHVYSRLMRKQPGYLKEAEYDFIGDLAESFEYSPDHLSMTLKLRPGLKWHNKPPINGRALDAEDVLFSWERVSRTSSQRVGFVNSANPDAPLLGFSAPDARTIVVKVKYPVSYLPGILARTTTGYLHMVPKETDSTFNIRNDMIGTGP
ncbi:ABC transporter substrate-binding protein, partial [Pseudorhodoplanes sp.]|uniref:ABC transporter substrate-binding protein n=1 Tax=Pseudorhodoplanes sp. TaxID=1934341 RepID=UPI003D112B61